MKSVDVDPELLEIVDQLPALDLGSSLTDVRAMFSQSQNSAMERPTEGIQRSEHLIGSESTVKVRVHRPLHRSDDSACLISMHGGGYVFGSSTMDDPMFDSYCSEFGCVGVSVDYRLAPETPYPGPLEDCYAALVWTFANWSDLGINRTRIGIRGESAGGGLAAGLSLLARDRGEVELAFALLECPMLDDRQSTPSSQYIDLKIWSKESNEFGWKCYLGELYGSDDIPSYAAPGRADDLRGLPETLVIVGGADGFRDEDVLYALHLGQAGVQTDLAVIAGAPHGVGWFAGTGAATRWTETVSKWLRPRLSSVQV